MTTYEEACRCPKCETPGQVMSKNKGKRPGVQVHVVFCRTEGCKWYNTSWLVQVNEDGSIPQAYEQVGPKQYPKFSQETETRIQEAIDAQLAAEVRPGSEIRNPYSR